MFAALQRIGWSVKREAKGSHKVLQRDGFSNFVWASMGRENQESPLAGATRVITIYSTILASSGAYKSVMSSM